MTRLAATFVCCFLLGLGVCYGQEAPCKFGIRAGRQNVADLVYFGGVIYYFGVFIPENRKFDAKPFFNLGYLSDMAFGNGRSDFVMTEAGGSFSYNRKYFRLRINTGLSMYILPKDFFKSNRFNDAGLIFFPSIGTGEMIKHLDLDFLLGTYIAFDATFYLRTGFQLAYKF